MTYMESTVGACSSFLPQGLLIQPQFCMYLNYPNPKAVLPHAVVSVDMGACVCCWLLCMGQVQPSHVLTQGHLICCSRRARAGLCMRLKCFGDSEA